MANDCLKTTFKKVVQNDNLVPLGKIRLQVNATSSMVVAKRKIIINGPISVQNPFIISVVGGAAKLSTSSDFSNPTSTLTATTSYYTFYLLEGTYSIDIYNKYYIWQISLAAGESTIDHSVTFNLNDLDYSPLNKLDIPYSRAYGNIDRFTNAAFTQFLVSGCTNIEGSLISLASTTITNVKLYKTQISGNVEDFAAACVTKGRTSGTCTFAECHQSGVKYNGSSFKSLTVSFTGTGIGYTISDVVV